MLTQLDRHAYFPMLEVDDAQPLAGRLFERFFGHATPSYPRHFVLLYCPNKALGTHRTVAYVHQLPFGEVHLAGGMFVDERSYRALPSELYAEIRQEGGFGTMVLRESIARLGDSPAAFAYVGEPRSRRAVIRAGFVDAGEKHLMVYWRKPLSHSERIRLIQSVAAHGPF
jgi:hypothetical protein